MVSVTMARGIGKYKYFSKGAGFYHHGSSNLEAPMDRAQVCWHFAAVEQPINVRWARDQDMMHLLHCLFFLALISIVISTCARS